MAQASVVRLYSVHRPLTVLVRFQPNFMINMLVIGEYRLLLFLVICQKLKILWHCEIFVNKGLYACINMGLEISNRSSYSFLPMSTKLYEDIGYHGGIQPSTFLGNWPSFKNFVAL